MGTIERLNITLPADMARLVRSKVAEGRYASNSELIREALRTWAEQEEVRAHRLAALRQRIDEADAETAPPLTDADVERHFQEKLQRSMADRDDCA